MADAVAVVLLGLLIPSVTAAGHAETVNFIVHAETTPTAVAIAESAEELRATLAREWLGRELSDWPEKCIVHVDCDRPRLSGDTTYSLIRGDVARWRIELRGPVERILEILVPHEVLHTVLASHFRDAVPRWADEGAALSVEAPHEQDRLWKLHGGRLLREPRPPLSELFDLDVYPENAAELRDFYLQGAAITQFLLMAGKTRFVEFISAGRTDGWTRAVQHSYGFDSIEALEAAWTKWLVDDRPVVVLTDGQALSDAFGVDREFELAGGPTPAISP